MTPLGRQILDHVSAFPGATCREISEALFGEGRARSPERSRVSAALKGLVDAGAIGRTVRPKSDGAIPCFAFWPIDEYEPPREAVMLDHTQRFLIRHVLRWGIDRGDLGPPSQALLEHLVAEEKRLDALACGAGDRPITGSVAGEAPAAKSS